MSRRRRPDLQGIPADRLDLPPSSPSLSPDSLVLGVVSLLSPDFVRSVYKASATGLRERALPLPLVALLLVAFCLSGLPSFAALLAALADGSLAGLGAVLVSRQAFYQRLDALGHERFLLLLQSVTRHLHTPLSRPWVRALAPWAAGIYAVDDTTLDALVRRVPELAAFPKGSSFTLAGRLGTLLDLSTGLIHEILYDSSSLAREYNHLLPLLGGLAPSSLLVFDLGYFSFPLFDALTERQLFFVTRLRQKTSYQVSQVLADRPLYRDRLIFLGAYRSDRAAHPVRLVELYLEGKWWSYLTNQTDAHLLPAESIWRLYSERWTIEMAFFALKRVLGLATLRGSKVPAVLAQIWCTLAVYQIMQSQRLEIAHAQGLKADDISWERLMRRIQNYAMLTGPKPPLRAWLVTRPKLAKEGVKYRRPKTLPDEVVKECRQGRKEMPAVEGVEVRSGRQGKREATRHSVITVANLHDSSQKEG